jgi:hypothetical protein
MAATFDALTLRDHSGVPGAGAFMNGRVPASLVPVIVADFGNVGGGIWLI